MAAATITVTCPSCGHKSPLSEAVLGLPREGVRKELSAVIGAFSTMKEDREAEKRALTKHWAKREKQLSQVVKNMFALYGDIQGVSGNALPHIEVLSLES